MQLLEVVSDTLYDEGELRHVPSDGLLPLLELRPRQFVILVQEINDARKTLSSVVVELAWCKNGVSGRRDDEDVLTVRERRTKVEISKWRPRNVKGVSERIT